MAQVVILGAGLTGLSAAYHFEKKGFFDFKIFEKNETPGGLLRSINQDDFTFDFTGHWLHINDKYFLEFLKTIAGIENFDLINRNASIYIQKTLTNYPFQMNLAELPENIIFDSIYSFINRKKNIKKAKSFYEWVLKYFGYGMGKHFFFPYNKKILSYDIKKITPSWTGRFVPKTNLKPILKNILNKKIKSDIGYNSQFYYPKNGGIEYIIKKITTKLKTKINTNFNAESIDLKTKTIYFENGHKEKFTKLITTIPLNNLLKNLKENSNSTLKNVSKKLLCNSVINFNLGLNKENLINKHWIYFPEKKYSFYRIGFWNNIATKSAPKGYSSIYGEISYLPETKSSNQIFNLTEKSINHTLEILNLKKENIVIKKILNITHAYVIYDFWREQNLKKLLKKLEYMFIYSIGRYGEWKYSSMQEAVLDGKNISEKLLINLDKIKVKSQNHFNFINNVPHHKKIKQI